MRCGNKVSDVIGRPERCRNKMMSFSVTANPANIAMMKKKKKKKLESSDDDEQLVHLSSAANQTRQLSFRENYIPTWLCGQYVLCPTIFYFSLNQFFFLTTY